jgi:pimeloyl-ACP methyl ester carboxylesterase
LSTTEQRTTVREHDLAVCGLAVHARTAGTGPPVVVLHHSFGAPVGAAWTALHDDLAVDHAVHVPDLPGFGRSERPDWARDTRDLSIVLGHWVARQELGPVTLVGAGFGGWLAAQLATMRPELLSGLVLVGAAGLLPREGRILDQFLTSHSEYVRAAFHDPAAYDAVFGTELTDELLLALDEAREMTTRVAWKPYMYDRRLEPLLAEVQLPALVVWGELDHVVPMECAHRYVAALPRARLEVVAGSGHAVDLERPAELAALIRRHVRGA